MSPEAKQKIQLALAVTIAVVGIRAGYIVYERYSERAADAAEASRKAAPLNPDDYVVPKKLYPYRPEVGETAYPAAGLGQGRLPAHLLSLRSGTSPH